MDTIHKDMDNAADNPKNVNDTEKCIACPICRGTGQLEKSRLPFIEKTIIRNPNKLVKSKSPVTVKLPAIDPKSARDTILNKNCDYDAVKRNLVRKRQYLLKPQSAGFYGDNVNERGDFVELLPPPTTLRNPSEAIRYSLLELGNENWEIVMQGLGTLVQVSRTHPMLLEPHMQKINQTLCNSFRTMRSQVSRFACQASKEFFRTMQSTNRPEFDEIVQCLLQRTADMNKFIRHDANEALDAMITYIPPVNSVRAIVEKGPLHKNALVRTATARLLVCVVAMIHVHSLLTLGAYRETRKRVFDASARLMNDPNMTTRNTIKKLFELFIKEEEFETLFFSEVDKQLLKKMEKALVCLKYKMKKMNSNENKLSSSP